MRVGRDDLGHLDLVRRYLRRSSVRRPADRLTRSKRLRLAKPAPTVCSDPRREYQDRVMTSPRAGQPAAPEDLIDVSALSRRLLRSASRSGHTGTAGQLRHVRTPGIVAYDDVQRRPHHRHKSGDLRVPRQPRHHWPALPRRRHPCTERTRYDVRPQGVRRERRHRSSSTPGTDTHPLPALSRAILAYNADRSGRASPMASS